MYSAILYIDIDTLLYEQPQILIYSLLRRTQATCTAQGFFLQFGLAIPIYNGCLALYYLLIVRYGISDDRMKRWIEPAMQSFAFVVAAGTALAGIPLDLYSADDVPMCWIKNHPIGCTETWQSTPENPANCERGDNSSLYRFAFYLSWVWGSIFAATFATILLYWTVRSLEKKTTRYRNPRNSIVSRMSADSTQEVSTNADRLSGDSSSQLPTRIYRKSSSGVSSQGSFSGRGKQRAVLSKTMRTSIKTLVSRGSIVAEESQHNPRSRQVYNQAVWYIVAFFLTHIFACIQQVIFFSGGIPPFWMIAIHMFCDPGQGIYNFVVYRRPRYIYIRSKNPELSCFQCLRLSLRWSFLGSVDLTNTRSRKATTIVDANTDEEYDSLHGCDDDYQHKFDEEEPEKVPAAVDDLLINSYTRPMVGVDSRSAPSGYIITEEMDDEPEEDDQRFS